VLTLFLREMSKADFASDYIQPLMEVAKRRQRQKWMGWSVPGGKYEGDYAGDYTTDLCLSKPNED
jgi:hypothetical protein